jgi:hypothetical protein
MRLHSICCPIFIVACSGALRVTSESGGVERDGDELRLLMEHILPAVQR